MFANMCRAYEGWPEATRRPLDGLTALSTYDYVTVADSAAPVR